jgi:YfiH family protein
LICRPLEDAGFVNGFSTRLGGVSDFPKDSLNLAGFDEDSSENIYENRRRFLSIFNGEFELATAWQVHGDGVKIVRTSEDLQNSEERFDALVSAREGTLVGVKTADCVPILIGDPVTGSFSAIHAGWKGTAAHIVSNAVEKMRTQFGADPRSMIAAVGPCASGENYEVGTEVIERFSSSFPDHRKYFRETRPGHALVDLRLANRELMTAAGIRQENIHTAPFCTIARTDIFFSFRAEKRKFGRTGRLMSVIGRH